MEYRQQLQTHLLLKAQNIGLSNVGEMNRVCALLTNAHTSLYKKMYKLFCIGPLNSWKIIFVKQKKHRIIFFSWEIHFSLYNQRLLFHGLRLARLFYKQFLNNFLQFIEAVYECLLFRQTLSVFRQICRQNKYDFSGRFFSEKIIDIK